MDIHALQATLRDFAAARHWQPFQTPKNLAMALMVEAAELMEIFQWLTPEQSARAADEPARRQHIGEEIADVLIYLVQLADHTQVDIAAAVHDKLQRNARKYPAAGAAQGLTLAAPPAQAQADTHVLLDYENVQPGDADLRALVPQASKLWVFHGPHQKQAGARFASFGTDLTTVPISKSGKNALDFHLSFYMGYIAARNPQARFVVLANDRGYEPMLEHARHLGFDVRAVGVARVAKTRVAHKRVQPAPAPAAPKVAKAAPTRVTSKVAPKAAAKKAAPVPKVPAPRPATRPAAAKKVAAKKRLPEPAAAPKAATPARKKAGSAPAKAAPSPAPGRKAGAKAAVKAPAAGKAPRPAPAAGAAAMGLKIEQGLRKLGSKRPSRLARLRGVLKSLLGPEASEDTISAALARLVAARVVSVDAGGQVAYPGWD